VKKGFTLIELLIVVAIIAILAAIAVPNFLEAQVRSKVSRAKADQRSLATAIESYFVDNNLYPAAAREGTGNCQAPNNTVPVNPTSQGNFNKYVKPSSPPSNLANVFSFAARSSTQQMMLLTTPISYITSYPADPFADTKGATFCYFANANGWILWSCGPDTDEAQGTELGFVTAPGPNKVETIYDVSIAQPSAVLIAGQAAANRAYTYDPTNGTVSPGDVYRVKQ